MSRRRVHAGGIPKHWIDTMQLRTPMFATVLQWCSLAAVLCAIALGITSLRRSIGLRAGASIFMVSDAWLTIGRVDFWSNFVHYDEERLARSFESIDPSFEIRRPASLWPPIRHQAGFLVDVWRIHMGLVTFMGMSLIVTGRLLRSRRVSMTCRCSQCGYDLSGHVVPAPCPECGRLPSQSE